MPTVVYYTHFLTYFLHPTVLLEVTSPETMLLVTQRSTWEWHILTLIEFGTL